MWKAKRMLSTSSGQLQQPDSTTSEHLKLTHAQGIEILPLIELVFRHLQVTKLAKLH
jgi:hypothetical protein